MRTTDVVAVAGPGTKPRHPLRARRGRKLRRVLLIGVSLTLLAFVMPIAIVQIAGNTRVHTRDDTPPRTVALVLGAGLRPGGKPSSFLTRRLDMARQLYEDGKVQAILVSGDNALAEHNEPSAMFNWLVDAGVPEGRIVRDHAGFDTHDSCVRAHDVFGVRDLVVVTQDYHVPRAVFSCNAAGIDAVGIGVASTGVSNSTAFHYRVREAAASVKAAWDALIRRPPVHGGKETSITDLLDQD